MVYNTVSTESVVSRIIRNCKLQDATYADDIYEWINEAVDQLLIRWRLPRTYKKIDITDHVEALPCELVVLDAVVYNGQRLRLGEGILDNKAYPLQPLKKDITTYFSDTTSPEWVNQQDYSILRGLDLTAVDTINTIDFYNIEPGYIKTSFETGSIWIFYKIRKTDKYGLPLIPDIEAAKEGIFYYVAGKLLFSGLKLPNPDVTIGYCDERSSILLKKAKSTIKSMSMEEKESQLQMWNNLIPPQGYYSQFFINAEQPKITG